MAEGTGEKPNENLPLFIQAALRVRSFLEGQVGESGVRDEETLDRISAYMVVSGQLVGLGQMLEFTNAHPDLAGTSAVEAAREDLVEALAGANVPDEIKDIYVNLYALAPYLEAEQTPSS